MGTPTKPSNTKDNLDLNALLASWKQIIETEYQDGKTNSRGIKDMYRILNKYNNLPNSSPEGLFTVLLTIAHERLHKTSQWYAKSSVFGKGRSETVEKLYREITQYGLDADNNLTLAEAITNTSSMKLSK